MLNAVDSIKDSEKSRASRETDMQRDRRGMEKGGRKRCAESAVKILQFSPRRKVKLKFLLNSILLKNILIPSITLREFGETF